MDLNMVKDIMSEIKPGTFFRCGFYSSIPLKAEYRNMGYKIIKVANIITRSGIYYGNIRGVDFDSLVQNYNQNRTNNFIWEIPRVISYNTQTKAYYLNLYPVQHINCSFTFTLQKDDMDLKVYDMLSDKELIDMILPSYLNKMSETKVMKVNVNNIFNIHQKNIGF